MAAGFVQSPCLDVSDMTSSFSSTAARIVMTEVTSLARTVTVFHKWPPATIDFSKIRSSFQTKWPLCRGGP
jgi:hypothetical protein